MIRHAATLVFVLAALDGGLRADNFRLSDETTTTHTLRFAGGGDRTLTIRNINGAVRVTGSADSAVQLTVRRIVRADSRDDLRRGGEETRLTTADGRADVEAVVTDVRGSTCGASSRNANGRRNPPYSVEYEITAAVPAGTRLVLCTINGSEIDVARTSGDFDIDNVNGRIRMTGVRGSGSATTVNGRIEATFLDVPTRDSQFETVNGSVAVTWPANLSADLQMKTMNGGLFTDFDVQAAPAPLASPSRRNGRFTYRSNNTASVRVGRGGPVLKLESVNGDVRVLRAGQ